MFKRLITAAAVLLASYIAAHAVPAYPYPQTVTQPDGTVITYVLHGDEFGSVATTIDGILLQTDADALSATVLPDGTVEVRTACTTSPIEVYNICGQCIHRINPSNEAISFQILDHGVYILRQNTDTLKIIY